MVEDVFAEIRELSEKCKTLLIAIDGRCGAGKTTLAEALQKTFCCNIIHVDHFFLRPEQRSPERLRIPGENVDYERLLSEVIEPISQKREFAYRPYNCKTGALGEVIHISPTPITVVEGSYSCHPKLWHFYDLHIFVDIDSETQMERIKVRNGMEVARVFKERWIPLEEAYFEKYSVRERCEMRINGEDYSVF